MQQIADWLEKLGMPEYVQCFADNKIDVSVLRHLTDQDLKDIGIPLGHRRKMLAAINEMTGTAPATPAATPATEPKPQDTAERRQVTVMFSDLVGSTALSARMDPEDLREVITAYQKCVADAVQHFGGFVAKYMGDGVLFYFGYPQAHEDDAERAVRAGLELVTAVSALKTHAPLQTRVGIATGLVIVGDLIGSGASQEQAVVGETPNLAARLQAVAEPNSVVIAEGTRKLVGNLFEVRDLGAQNLKGISGPVPAWAALRPASVESRFDAFHATGLTELVGRAEELDLLLRRWSKAKTGEGQVVLLSGEPGMRNGLPATTKSPADCSSAVSTKLLVTTKSSFFVTSASSRTVNTMRHPSSGVPILPTYQTAAWSVFRNSCVWSVFAKRLQIQERMTTEIAQTIDQVLRPRGVAVVIEAVHECMTTRGVHGYGVSMVTSRMLGAFRDNPETRQEFLAAIGLRRGARLNECSC